MEVAINNQSNYVSMSEKERTIAKTELNKDIKKVRQVTSDLTFEISNLARLTSTFKGQISEKKSQIQSLNNIAEKHGDNSIVRLKGKQFKYGEPSNFIKKILHSNRYETERKKASEIMKISTTEISAKTSISELNKQVKSLEVDLKMANTNLGKIQKDLTLAENLQYEINNDISAIKKIEDNEKKANEAKQKAYQDFCLVYQSNEGCKALNKEARKIYRNSVNGGSLISSKVIREYERVHGSEIFGRGNKDLKYRIQAQCEDLSNSVKEAAKAVYTPSLENVKTYRGQGMTLQGIELLQENYEHKPDTVYIPGQFFSTSSMKAVATSFANQSDDHIKVLFTVNGNSSKGLSVPGGLTFNNNEGERLYSPIANFKVTKIEHSGTNYYVSLQETKQEKDATLLPY
ncbi:hypothetical protein NTH48_003271 [Vibrio cholerae]